MDVKKATDKLAELTLMKFFPTERAARAALVAMVCAMASSNEQVDWLVRRALALYNEWPGPRELRALFCSRWKPADGIEARSTVYIADEAGGGFPSEQPKPQPIWAIGRDEERRLLLDIGSATLDATADTSTGKGKISFPVLRVNPALPTIPPGKAITAADIARVKQELREKRARAELKPESPEVA